MIYPITLIYMFHFRRRTLFQRGFLRYLLLKALDEKPMHGYEIMKVLGEEFGGFYIPSTGVIYPMFQTLEDQGYLTGEERGGKKVYSITPEGKELLKENEDKFKAMVESRKAFIEERKGLNKELRSLISLIRTNYRDLTPEKAEKIRQILQEARRKITDVIFE